MSGVRSNIQIKTSVYWITTCSFEETHILKMKSIISFYRDTKYPLEISLIEIGYSGPTTLVKSTKVYIY